MINFNTKYLHSEFFHSILQLQEFQEGNSNDPVSLVAHYEECKEIIDQSLLKSLVGLE